MQHKERTRETKMQYIYLKTKTIKSTKQTWTINIEKQKGKAISALKKRMKVPES